MIVAALRVRKCPSLQNERICRTLDARGGGRGNYECGEFELTILVVRNVHSVFVVDRFSRSARLSVKCPRKGRRETTPVVWPKKKTGRRLYRAKHSDVLPRPAGHCHITRFLETVKLARAHRLFLPPRFYGTSAAPNPNDVGGCGRTGGARLFYTLNCVRNLLLLPYFPRKWAPARTF